MFRFHRCEALPLISPKNRNRLQVCCTVLLALSFSPLRAQTSPPQANTPQPNASLPEAPEPSPSSTDAVTLRNTPAHLLGDQKGIWTSPLRLHTQDLNWLVPLAAATAAGIGTDHYVSNTVVTHNARINNNNVIASNVLIGGFLAAPVALYGFGHFHDDPHAREAGILGGEALLDGVVVEQGMKLIFWRERPAVDNARGHFFQGSAGVDSSFPSSHSVLAWSAAAVLAGEYPSPWKQAGIYFLASAVSVTRVLGEEHFPSDVLVGSAAGWLVGHYVFRHHHKGISAAFKAQH